MNTQLLRTAILRRTPVQVRTLTASAILRTKTPAPAAQPSPTGLTPEEDAAHRDVQAPNRATTWSKSQRPRALGMTGPRFEQTNISQQPAPYAAIELIHQQPVRWTKERVVACDGGRFS